MYGDLLQLESIRGTAASLLQGCLQGGSEGEDDIVGEKEKMIGEVIWGCEQSRVDHLTLGPKSSQAFCGNLEFSFFSEGH